MDFVENTFHKIEGFLVKKGQYLMWSCVIFKNKKVGYYKSKKGWNSIKKRDDIQPKNGWSKTINKGDITPKKRVKLKNGWNLL